MPIIYKDNDSAIVRGIKTVGVGKKGSRGLTPDLAQDICQDLKDGKVPLAAQGAFFAGLIAKGIEPQEQILAGAYPSGRLDPESIVDNIAPDAPDFIRRVCTQILNGQTLDVKTAYDLGRFLFSNEPGDGARGLIASFLRVRYETDDEYEGIWRAMQETINPPFQGPTPTGDPIIQMAEPFDGNDHTYMVTPLIAQYLQSQGYRVMHMVGRNSGPKLVYNLFDVAAHLPVTFARQNSDLAHPKPAFGWFFNQKDVSGALDRWVDIRRQTIKRPFLATLEKFIKPLQAKVLITSAFHPPYGEKMTTIAERAGFPWIIVIRNGAEGSIAFPLKRPARILVSARQKDGSYRRHEILFDPASYLTQIPDVEEDRVNLTAAENAQLIQAYAAHGVTGDPWFDMRVKATVEGIRQGLEWLKQEGKDAVV